MTELSRIMKRRYGLTRIVTFIEDVLKKPDKQEGGKWEYLSLYEGRRRGEITQDVRK